MDAAALITLMRCVCQLEPYSLQELSCVLWSSPRLGCIRLGFLHMDFLHREPHITVVPSPRHMRDIVRQQSGTKAHLGTQGRLARSDNVYPQHSRSIYTLTQLIVPAMMLVHRTCAAQSCTLVGDRLTACTCRSPHHCTGPEPTAKQDQSIIRHADLSNFCLRHHQTTANGAKRFHKIGVHGYQTEQLGAPENNTSTIKYIMSW